ncbi:MAG TPA: GAF domain-containing sensor histidine kinase [Actinomycetota bacterium]|nr:GAF domain-containing sensor histidine kinase [Actinomycetota bacterium]
MAEQPSTPVRERRPVGAGRVPEPLGPRALRIGLRTTLLAPLGAAASVALLGNEGPGLGEWLGFFLGLVVVGAIVAFLPWDRLRGTDIGRRVLHAWAVLNVLLITLAGWSAGAADPSLPLGYGVAIVFFAVVLSSRAQLGFLALLLLCYAAVLVSAGFEPLPFAMLAVLGVLAAYLSGELRRRIAAHDRARVDAERRWAVVGAVSSAARDMTASDPRRVLQGIVDAIVALGYETAAIHVPDGPADLRVVLPAGVGDEPARGIRSVPEAIRARVLEQGRDATVTLEDVDRAAARGLRASGVQTIAATPILVGSRPAGVLLVAGTSADGIGTKEVESFAMLAATASMALGNARRAEEERRVEARVVEADRARADVTASLAKEVRKPLDALTGTPRELRDTYGSEDRQRLIRRLLSNATALDVTLGGSLDLSMLEVEPAELEPTEIDVGRLVAAVLERLTDLFEGRELRAEVPEGIVVEADGRLLETAVEHLLLTAATSSPVGKALQVSVARAGDGAVVKVAGDGTIPVEQLAAIRQPSAERDGTIGPLIRLALAARIVEVHGSELQVLSEPGRGTTVWFLLPRERSAQPAVAGWAQAEVGPVQLTLDDALLPAIAAEAARHDPPEVAVPEEERHSTPLAAAALAATAASSLVVTGVLPDLLRQPQLPAATQADRDDGRANGQNGKRDRRQERRTSEDGGSATPAADTSDGTGGSTTGTTGSTTGGTDGGGTTGGGGTGGGTGGGGTGGGGGGGGGEPSPSPSPDDRPGKSGEAPGHNKDEPTPSPSP